MSIIISSKILKTRKERLLAGLFLEIKGFAPKKSKSCSQAIADELGITGIRTTQYKQLRKEIANDKVRATHAEASNLDCAET